MDVMDIAHDICLPSALLNRATHIAAPFFTDRIAEALLAPKASGVMDFAQIVEDTALSSFYNDTRKFHEYPSSIPAFITIAGGVFCKKQIQTLTSHAKKFDKISGFSGATSDYFIATRPAVDSLRDVIRAIVLHAATQVQELLNTPTNMARHTGPGALDDTCPIVQIELEGPTLADAWNANATTKEMEELATSVPSDADPSSMAYRALAVYHGTAWTGWDELMAPATPYEPSRTLRPASNRNQVAPGGPLCRDALKVVWTGFSPLRCFLWAVFQGEVLQQVPTGAAKARLEREWDCDPSFAPHTHKGVTLFKLRPTLPSAFGQSHYLMPKGREAEWNDIVKGLEIHVRGTHLPPIPEDLAAGAKYLWDRFSGIHRGTLDTWPNALHCREYGEQLATLRIFTKQTWWTVWYGAEQIGALNRSREVAYAISFKLTSSSRTTECCSVQ